MALRNKNNSADGNGVGNVKKDVLPGVDEKDFNIERTISDIERYLTKNNSDLKKYVGNNAIELLTSLAIAAKDSTVDRSENLRKKVGTSRNLVQGMFNNNNTLMGLFELERKRIERYQDYQMLEVYIPQVAYCIDIIKNSIISPDNITKEFLNILINNENLDESKDVVLVKNIYLLKNKFKLNTFMSNTIRETLMLGDQFMAVLSYKKEMEDILMQKSKDGLFLKEDENNPEDMLLESSLDLDDIDLDIIAESLFHKYSYNESKTNSSTDEKLTLVDVKKGIRTKIVDVVNKNIVFTDKPIIEYLKDTVNDIDSFNRQKASSLDRHSADSFKPLNIEGAFIKKLDPKKTIKLVSEDGLCYGYLYIEQMENKTDRNEDRYNVNDGVPFSDVMSQINGDLFAGSFEVNEKGRVIDKDRIIANIFGKVLMKKLNRPFITKNKEFIDYVYGLAKSQELLKNKTKIVYFSPDEVKHFKFNENKDHYGTSVLARSLFFGMLYISTIISELMTKVARGRDTRAIMVEVGLDGDIEGAIQNTISDIKSKEINIDNLSSISSILRTLSTFDDYFIPVIDGERPIEFDTVPGGGTDVDTDFLDNLLKSVVAGTGVPGNMVDASMDIEFARTIVSNNDQFARMIINYQMEATEQWTDFINMLYNAEYVSKKDKVQNISITFPTPMALMLTTMNENISNSQQTVDFIVNTYIDENSQNEEDFIKKHLFKKRVTQEIMGTIDWAKFDDIFDAIEDEAKQEKYYKDINPSPEDDMMMGGGMDDEEGGGDFGGMM